MRLLPAKVISRDAGYTCGALRRRHGLHQVGHDKHGGRHAGSHDVVAQRHAACDLDVNELVQLVGRHARPLGITGYQFCGHGLPRSMRQGVGHAQFAQTAVQPGHMLRKAKGLAGIDRQHFIDAVAKNEATVQHADFGVLQGGVLAIEVAQGARQISGRIACQGWGS